MPQSYSHITPVQFVDSISNLKSFFEEQDRLGIIIKVISPTSTAVVEFGDKFIDDYIKLLEVAMNDKSGMINWFIFDNEFGKKKLKVKFEGEAWNEINTALDLYYFVLNRES